MKNDRPWINLWARLLSEAEDLEKRSAGLAKEAAARRAEAELAHEQIMRIRASLPTGADR